MKTLFLVRPEDVLNFADILAENSLIGTIVDTDDENLIHIEVNHQRQERDVIEELAELTEVED